MTTDRSVVTVQELLQHRTWVQRLARSLVLDPHDADDLEQQTWREALERPPVHRANLRAWLARIVRRRRLDLGRGNRRRAERERASTPKGSDVSPEEILERAETRARIAQHVLALEEPFRSTILLRF